MPRGIYTGLRCTSPKTDNFEPTKHQKETVDAFLKSPYKGMLLYHELGSGKTCTSILIADQMLAAGTIDRVYIFTPGSLRDGWVNEYCKVCGTDSDNLKNNYTFITYNYSVKTIPDLSNSLVIIDEVHNLINGVKNRSKHPTMIYDTLLKTECRVLALSGTPVYNYIYEFAFLMNLIKPGVFKEIRRGDTLDVVSFTEYFVVDDDGTITPKNPTKIRRMFEGVISYYPGAGEEYVPKLQEMPPIKVFMPIEQEKNYWTNHIQELKFALPPNEDLKRKSPKQYEILKRLYIMAKKNILTRSASNFYYPKDVQLIPDVITKRGGWIEKSRFEDGQLDKIYSAKIAALFTNIVAHLNQKHVLFTFFKVKAGAYLIKSILSMCGIKSEIFSGDLDDYKRRSLLKRFNAEKNMYGDDIRVLIVTEAGAEGISVLEARHMHILESSPRMSKTIQSIGRVARYKSHMRLPVEERSIKVWRYWSVVPQRDVKITTTVMDRDGVEKTITTIISDTQTIDETLYEKGMVTVRGVRSFLDLLKQISVTSYKRK